MRRSIVPVAVAVAVALAEGKLKLHAWVYDIASGEVFEPEFHRPPVAQGREPI